MKAHLFKILAVALLMVSNLVLAESYPYTTPTYIPNLRVATVPVAASGVANNSVNLNNIGTVSLQITGTCTSLLGRLEGSNDGINWVTLNLYPNAATVVAAAVTSVTTTGFWAANAGGMNYTRFNNSGITGSACLITGAGSPTAFALPH
jgi:hypothetical protein